MIFRTEGRSTKATGVGPLGAVLVTAAVVATGCGGGQGEAGSAASPEPSSAVAQAPAADPGTATTSGAPTAAAAPPAGTPATAAPEGGPLATVSWIVGSWSGTSAEGAALDETWSPAEGATMKGTSRIVGKDGKAITETLRIEARDGGAIVYVAQPGAAAPTEFTRDARTSGPTHAQFVNEQHDWPTRIRYERAGGELKVRLRGRTGQADESFVLKPR